MKYVYSLVSREVEAEHLPLEQIAALDAASAPETAMIYGPFTPSGRQNKVFGGSAVASRG